MCIPIAQFCSYVGEVTSFVGRHLEDIMMQRRGNGHWVPERQRDKTNGPVL